MVVINKIDRPGARPWETVDKVLELFIDLGCDKKQLEFPISLHPERRVSAPRSRTSGGYWPAL